MLMVVVVQDLSSNSYLPQQMTQPSWKESITEILILCKFHRITLG